MIYPVFWINFFIYFMKQKGFFNRTTYRTEGKIHLLPSEPAIKGALPALFYAHRFNSPSLNSSPYKNTQGRDTFHLFTLGVSGIMGREEIRVRVFFPDNR